MEEGVEKEPKHERKSNVCAYFPLCQNSGNGKPCETIKYARGSFWIALFVFVHLYIQQHSQKESNRNGLMIP